MNGRPRTRLRLAGLATASLTVLGLALVPALSASAQTSKKDAMPVPPGAIRHIIVVELENESFGATFGASSPATYLNDTLVPQGELLTTYYAIGHVSLDNYIAQVSGQAPNQITNSDCSGTYNDVTPGTLDPNQALYPGQVDGQGCVFPQSVQTIGNQLDRSVPADDRQRLAPVRRGHGQRPDQGRRSDRSPRRHRLRAPDPDERRRALTTPTTPRARTPPARRSSPRSRTSTRTGTTRSSASTR